MKITLNPNAKDAATRDALVAEGGFGKYYTDHMVMCEWSEKDGWGEPHLMPYGPISLDPATAVFHYGQEIFEGMKAYRQPDGSIALFRPTANAKRFANSAKRLALPEMPVELFMETVEALVQQERAPKVRRKVSAGQSENADIRAVESHLGDLLGLRVRIAQKNATGAGAVTFEYGSLDQLDMLCQRLTGEKF